MICAGVEDFLAALPPNRAIAGLDHPARYLPSRQASNSPTGTPRH